jgi:hypothetical protein
MRKRGDSRIMGFQLFPLTYLETQKLQILTLLSMGLRDSACHGSGRMRADAAYVGSGEATFRDVEPNTHCQPHRRG